MLGKYILVDRQPVLCEDLATWTDWYERGDEVRRVAKTEIGPVTVSTVFLGLDHDFGNAGRPVLFETMTFGDDALDEQERYCTWEEAERGHAAMVERVTLALRGRPLTRFAAADN